LRKYILLTAVCVMFVAGCATTEDLKRVQGDLDRRLGATNENIRSLKDDNAGIRGDLKKNDEAISAIRTRQAEIAADITGLRDSIQQLTGEVEALRKDLSAAQVRANHRDEDFKDLKEKLEGIFFKTNFLENFLGIGKKEDLPEPGEKGVKPGAKESPKGKMDKESAYAAAYEEFKAGKYDKARADFHYFLKQYPDTEYSDNAQFWIGECYFFEKKYEKAILEYDKVAKNYPEGDKVPYALLKQGLSFLNLGDKAGARLILQQVIRDYPNTNQARIARAKLLEIK
jgi:tol-pal system protein YbgF